MKKLERIIFFVSDSTGASAKVLGSGLLKQFEDYQFSYRLRPFIDSVEKAKILIEEINEVYQKTGMRPIVMATIVGHKISPLFLQASAVYFNFYETFISMLEHILGTKASHKTGQAHGISNERRRDNQINALEFALKNDDGLRTDDYPFADIVVFGPSRCAKTPTCLHLAMEYGVCAANYPLVEEESECMSLPKTLRPYKKQLFGLICSPKKLSQIREIRKPGSQYASYSQCLKEIKSMQRLCETESIEYANTSEFSVEEISALMMRRLNNLSI